MTVSDDFDCGVVSTEPQPTAVAPLRGDLPVMAPPLPTTLPLTRLRLTAIAQADLPLPDYAGSLLRGAFGAALRRGACMTGLPQCRDCALWRSCPYPAVFETPPAPTQFGQRFSAVPNPYVIEPPPIGLRRVAAGQPLVFHLVLFGEATLRQLPLIVHAWQRALRHGLGRERIGSELVEVAAVLPAAAGGDELLPVWDADGARVHPQRLEQTALRWPKGAPAELNHLTLQIHTPLRLQHDGHALGPQELSLRTLLAQLLRRLNLVLDLHCGMRPAPFDAPALLAAAEAGLRDDRSGLQWKDWTRYSARQRQEMTLGGVLGRWTLSGDSAVLAQLWPWLWLGQWLHLGKNATMGMGGYRLTWGTDGPAPGLHPCMKESITSTAQARKDPAC